MKRSLLLLSILVMVFVAPAGAIVPTADVVLVLDNSGSMRRNDPGFLVKEAVTGFIERLASDARVGVVIFDQNVTLAMPLTGLAEGGRDGVLDSLGRIDYRGQLTDSPSGVERAIYELKSNGRPDARKLVVFMTDGIVDTGDAALDIEKTRWLRTELAADAEEAGIAIFSIAFTENADFFLTQSLAQKTGGEYFRAPTPEDLAGVFQAINSSLAKPIEEAAPEPAPAPPPPAEPVASPPPMPAPEPALAPPPPPPAPAVDNRLLVGVGIGIAVLLIVIIIVLLRRRVGAAGTVASGYVPKAYLNDINGITADPAYEIGGRPAMLGRVAGNDANLDYIVVNQSTVGRRHALIEYRDFSFWIADQGSVNGTFVNGRRIESETRLKHGDRVRLHNFEFEFTVPELADSGQTVFSSPSADDGGERTVIASAPAGLAAAVAASMADDPPPAAPAATDIPEPDAEFSSLFEDAPDDDEDDDDSAPHFTDAFYDDEPDVADEDAAAAAADDEEEDHEGPVVEPLLVLGDDDEDDEEEFGPSQDELDARFEQMFDEEEAGDTGTFHELKTVMREPPEDDSPPPADEAFNESETVVLDEAPVDDPPPTDAPEDDDETSLDGFIDTHTFQSAAAAASASVPQALPALDSEDPTLTPDWQSVTGPAGGDDPDSVDLSLDDFMDSTVLEGDEAPVPGDTDNDDEDEDDDSTVLLPDEVSVNDPRGEDDDRTLMPSEVKDEPRKP
jgi:uncharacterized protein YegL